MQLFTTYADMGAVPPERSWSAIRSLRASPPEFAAKGDRRRTFTAALEQAEQLFSAAGRVGVATKPILVFYGLSQAGRAVAAATAASKSWRLSGHGIRSGESQESPRGLTDLTVRPDRSGSFGRLCSTLASSTMGTSMRLGDLWPLLGEVERHPFPGAHGRQSVSLHVDPLGWGTGMPTLRVGDPPARDLGVSDALQPTNQLGAVFTRQAEALDALLADYPTLAGRVPFTYAGQPIGLKLSDPGRCSVTFRWPEAQMARFGSPDEFCARLGVMTRGEWRAYPSLDGGDLPVHPLMVWWAILFRLSMLARYEPQAWQQLTDVNACADAVPIEHLLEVALSSVPQLLVHVLTRPTSTIPPRSTDPENDAPR